MTTAVGRGVFVAVPSFNHAAFVERTLRSIFRQTLPPDVLLVIDDGSTDGSPGIIEKVLKDCPFPACEFIARGNRGLCRTLNEALERADTPFFAYLGSDDLWRPDFLARRTAFLAERPDAVLAYGHGAVIDPADRIIDSSENWGKYVDGDAVAMLLRGGAPLSPTVLYRTAVLARNGWNESAKLEDYELYLRLSAEGGFAFDPSPPLAAWRRHAANTSREAEFMLVETLRAQRLTAARLGLDVSSLARANAALSWTYAEQLSRHGARRRAFELARRNLTAAPDVASVLKMALRLTLPAAVIEKRRERRERDHAARYGTFS